MSAIMAIRWYLQELAIATVALAAALFTDLLDGE